MRRPQGQTVARVVSDDSFEGRQWVFRSEQVILDERVATSEELGSRGGTSYHFHSRETTNATVGWVSEDEDRRGALPSMR